jgi:hypothetical protein
VPPLSANLRELLARLLAVPGLDSGHPFWPRDVLPPLPRAFRPQARAVRACGLQALERRGLVGRTADGRYYLTPAAVTFSLGGH